MNYTTFGRTGLRVSVAGLGCGGFSRLGMSTGKSEAESIAIVKLAIESGINLIDTASNYGTEEIVGKGIAGVPRDSLVIATKCSVERNGEVFTSERVIESLHASLRKLGTDYVDIFQLHGVTPAQYDRAMTEIVPTLLRERERGSFRFLGITESGANDRDHAMLCRAAAEGVWDSVMVAFNMLHRTATARLYPLTLKNDVGTLVMHAVRSVFAQPNKLADAVRALAEQGRVPKELANNPRPLDFLVHPDGAESVTDAAYRFTRYTQGVDVVLFGTGSTEHLHENVASLNRPPLPSKDVAKLLDLFANVSGLGLESHGRPSAGAPTAP